MNWFKKLFNTDTTDLSPDEAAAFILSHSSYDINLMDCDVRAFALWTFLRGRGYKTKIVRMKNKEEKRHAAVWWKLGAKEGVCFKIKGYEFVIGPYTKTVWTTNWIKEDGFDKELRL